MLQNSKRSTCGLSYLPIPIFDLIHLAVSLKDRNNENLDDLGNLNPE